MTEEELKEIISSCVDGNGQRLPSPEELTFFENYKQRKLWIVGQVDDRIIYYINFIMRWNEEDKGIPVEERKPITIYLHNYGGDIDFMWPFIDTIEMSQTPINTVAIGVAASAASLIFMAGNKRYMTKRSRVMIHEGSAQMSGDATKVMDATASYKKMLKQMKDYILERTNIPQSALNKKRSNDWELDAQFCLENGVCTHIIESMDEVI